MEEIRTEWRARTGFPVSMDPKALPLIPPRLKDFEETRLPLMDESGVTMQVLSASSPGVHTRPLL